MRSSSRLFPVSLHAAELQGPYLEDTYLLRPGNSGDNTVQLAVTHISRNGRDGCRGHVVLLHGVFANRRVWYPDWNDGLALALADAGYDVWMPELRGHGLSPRNRQFARNSLQDCLNLDLPAIARFIDEQAGQPAFWIGHSLGGLIMASLLARPDLGIDVRAAVFLHSQVDFLHPLLRAPGVVPMMRRWLRRPDLVAGDRNGFGPEDEPGQFLSDIVRWIRHERRGRRASLFARLKVPALFLSAQCDPLDRQQGTRRFAERLGGENAEYRSFDINGDWAGYSGHHALLSSGARQEGWSFLIRWLDQNRAPGAAFVDAAQPADLAEA